MGNYTFGEWLSEWYTVYKSKRLKSGSKVPIETAIRLHVPAEYKARPLTEITAFDLDKIISLIPPSRTQKVLYDVLVPAMTKAYLLGLIEKDVAKPVEPVRYTKKNGEALTLEQQTKFLHDIEGHKLERLFWFYILTGVRRSEALSLVWADVDFARGRILIRGTKTKSALRYLPMTDEMRGIMELLYNEQKKAIRGKLDGLRVFPYNADYVTKTFKRFCPSHKLHDLRHTFATRCAESNMQPSATQRLLGHSKIDMTMRVYTHVATEFVRSETQKFMLNPYEKDG